MVKKETRKNFYDKYNTSEYPVNFKSHLTKKKKRASLLRPDICICLTIVLRLHRFKCLGGIRPVLPETVCRLSEPVLYDEK